MIDRNELPPAGSPQGKAMKSELIFFNAVSIIGFLAWLGWHFLMGLSRAFGSASSSSGPDIGWVFIVLGIVGAACVVYSFFAPAGVAKFVALAPFALILLGQGLIAYLEHAHRN